MTTKKTTSLWNEASVRSSLPPVKVSVNGKVYEGRLSGRRNRFATVTVVLGNSSVSWEWSWDAIAHSLNNNLPLVL